LDKNRFVLLIGSLLKESLLWVAQECEREKGAKVQSHFPSRLLGTNNMKKGIAAFREKHHPILIDLLKGKS